MAAAADAVVGEHDFRGFCRRGPGDRGRGADHPGGRPRRAVDPGGRPTLLRFDIEAGSFCHQMVRSLVGALVAVGRGRGNAATMVERLRAGTRAGAASPAPAHGLCLGRCPTLTALTGLPGRVRGRILVGRPIGMPRRGAGHPEEEPPLRTYSPKAHEIERAWHLVDAEGLVLGRLATEVARILRGKHRPIFAPHVDTGDHVVVVNAARWCMTADKAADKFAYRHSGYPGGLKQTQLRRPAGPQPRGGRAPGRPGHAAQEHPRPPAAVQAEGLRRGPTTPTPPRTPSRSTCRPPGGPAEHEEHDARTPLPDHRSPQAGRGPRPLPARPGRHHGSTSGPSRSTSPRPPTACWSPSRCG